jgi:PilZ domain.
MSEVLPFAPPTLTRSSILRKERRRWQRVNLKLPMSFMDEDGYEHAGRTINLSGGGLMFRTKEPPFRGARLVCYIEQVGRMSGHVVRSSMGFVSLVSDAPFTKRDRLVDLLTWLANKDQLELTEERRSSRTPGTGLIIVQTKDGREMRCHVMDMSFVGVALATSDQRPLIGELVQVGSQRGRVARYLPEGFAIDFTR